MKRSSSASWMGPMHEGRGLLTSESGVLYATPYTFASRFEAQKGTNPEELVAAAHAGCFSMALAGELERMKLIPESIQTKAEVNIEKSPQGWAVTGVHLIVSARIPGADHDEFLQAANVAKANCPISKLLKVTITMEATLDRSGGPLRPDMTF